MFAVQLLILALYLVSWYKMFEKMGRQGWEGLIPIYNMIILLEVIKKRKHSDKYIFYTLRFDCSFAAANTIKPQLL